MADLAAVAALVRWSNSRMHGAVAVGLVGPADRVRRVEVLDAVAGVTVEPVGPEQGSAKNNLSSPGELRIWPNVTRL